MVKVHLREFERSFELINRNLLTEVLNINSCKECGDIPSVLVYRHWYDRLMRYHDEYDCYCPGCYQEYRRKRNGESHSL